MSVRIDRRQFLKAAAITSGAIGVGVAWPRGVHQPSAHAGSVNDCLVGGNSNFISTEVPNLGQTLSVERIYKRWGEELFTADVVASADAGRKLAMSVFPSSSGLDRRWADIASGKYDADIKDMAGQFKAFGATHDRKIGLAFNHEPENDRDASLGEIHLGNEADFRGAFQHFFSVLKTQGVTNILRTIILMGSSYNSGAADSYWPGSTYVDRLGVDCYNWFGSAQQPDGQWRSFQQIVQGANNYAVAKDRRLWVCETATLEDPNDGQRKAQWITDMGATIKSMPKIRVLMYFEGARNGWWLAQSPQGSPAALSSFKALLADPYFV